MVEMFPEGENQSCMASEGTHHHSLHILQVKASDNASPDSWGGRIDTTS